MRILALLAALLFGIPVAHAQSTAGPVVTGYLDANGKFVQYGAGGGSSGNLNLNGINGVTPDVGSGVTDTGSLRTTQAQDITTVAGSAPGTAGTPSANVVSVQGVSGGTVVPVAPSPSSASSAGIAPVVSASAEGTHVLKNSPGNLYDLYVTTGGTGGYLMVFNATSAPGDGAVTPLECVVAAPNTTTSLFTGGAPPEVFSTGISVAFSTTGCFTKTASATAFFHGRVQ